MCTRPGECYTKQQINTILQHISKRCPSGQRLRAFVAIAYGAGTRIEELTDLLPGDLLFDTGKVIIKSGKGDKYRQVGFPEELMPLVEKWIDTRKALLGGNAGNKPLFCTLKGAKTSTEYYRGACKRISKRILKKTGILIRIHPHAFRHSMANSLVQEGFDILSIMQQLGHSNLSTTQRYLQRIAPEKLINSMFTRKGVL